MPLHIQGDRTTPEKSRIRQPIHAHGHAQRIQQSLHATTPKRQHHNRDHKNRRYPRQKNKTQLIPQKLKVKVLNFFETLKWGSLRGRSPLEQLKNRCVRSGRGARSVETRSVVVPFIVSVL